MIIIPEQDNAEGTAQLIPELFSGRELSPTPLVCEVTKFKNLMDIKGKEIKDKEIHGKMLLAVPVVMLNMITLVFQGVKGLVFDLPASATASHQHPDIVAVNGEVRNPAVVVGCFFTVDDPILKKIDLLGILCTIKRDIVDPMVLVASTFHIHYFEMISPAHSRELLYPFKENLMV